MAGVTAQADSDPALAPGTVVFTGKLASMTRRDAAAIVERAGGRVVTTVSRRTSTVVVGMEGWPLLPDGRVSRSLRRAEEMKERGDAIQIISEAVFLERLGLQERQPQVRKSYPAEQVCQLVGLDPAVLRRWEVMGLVRSRRGLYDFQDIVSLRTLAELIGRGVSPQTIGKSVRGLASVLPDTERPLAQLKLVEASGALLAELGDILVAPDGQLLMNFQTSDTPPPPSLTLTGPEQPTRSAHDWFQRAHACEEEERFEEAISAYRRALALQPVFPEAHFNLGNVLRAVDRLEAAEEHLLMAVTHDPALAAAWYNLADVQEELGRLEDAIASLNAALTTCPTYPDAHYNLALCYEEVGQEEDARRHWREYLKLDPDSVWADKAREYLASHVGEEG